MQLLRGKLTGPAGPRSITNLCAAERWLTLTATTLVRDRLPIASAGDELGQRMRQPPTPP
jgi:hypothetical protein